MNASAVSTVSTQSCGGPGGPVVVVGSVVVGGSVVVMSSVVVPGGGIVVVPDAESDIDAEVTGPAVVELGLVFPVPVPLSVSDSPDGESSEGHPIKRQSDPTIAPTLGMRGGSHTRTCRVWHAHHVRIHDEPL